MADDHPLFADSLTGLLEFTGEYQVVGTAYNGSALLAIIPEKNPDIVIIDISMPGMDGITCCRQIKQDYPQIKVLMLTMYNNRSFITQLVEAGADGCVLKSSNSEELLVALRRVQENKSYYDSVPNFKPEMVALPVIHEVKLSERETEIVRLVVKGATSADIAATLFISEHTVRTHRKNIFRKLNINNMNQLIQFAIDHGLKG